MDGPYLSFCIGLLIEKLWYDKSTNVKLSNSSFKSFESELCWELSLRYQEIGKVFFLTSSLANQKSAPISEFDWSSHTHTHTLTHTHSHTHTWTHTHTHTHTWTHTYIVCPTPLNFFIPIETVKSVDDEFVSNICQLLSSNFKTGWTFYIQLIVYFFIETVILINIWFNPVNKCSI